MELAETATLDRLGEATFLARELRWPNVGCYRRRVFNPFPASFHSPSHLLDAGRLCRVATHRTEPSLCLGNRIAGEFTVYRTKAFGSPSLVVARASKLNVVESVKAKSREDAAALCLGDSGAVIGSDHDLISSPSGKSVDAVCCSPEGSWTLFGYEHARPDALRIILASLIPSANGGVRFASDGMRLDK